MTEKICVVPRCGKPSVVGSIIQVPDSAPYTSFCQQHWSMEWWDDSRNFRADIGVALAITSLARRIYRLRNRRAQTR